MFDRTDGRIAAGPLHEPACGFHLRPHRAGRKARRRHILKLTDPLMLRRPANSKADSIRREAAMNKMNAIL
jgi:hypothetical protein